MFRSREERRLDDTMDAINKASQDETKSKFFKGKYLFNGPEIGSPEHIKVMAEMLDNGEISDINLGYGPGSFSDTALIYQTRDGTIDGMKFLLERGADPNIEGKGLQTALHWAVEKDDPDKILLLLKSGANPYGKGIPTTTPTPLIKAQLNNKTNAIAAFKQYESENGSLRPPKSTSSTINMSPQAPKASANCGPGGCSIMGGRIRKSRKSRKSKKQRKSRKSKKSRKFRK